MTAPKGKGYTWKTIKIAKILPPVYVLQKRSWKVKSRYWQSLSVLIVIMLLLLWADEELRKCSIWSTSDPVQWSAWHKNLQHNSIFVWSAASLSYLIPFLFPIFVSFSPFSVSTMSSHSSDAIDKILGTFCLQELVDQMPIKLKFLRSAAHDSRGCFGTTCHASIQYVKEYKMGIGSEFKFSAKRD